MDKNLSWKIVLIAALVVLAVWVLYPPSMTLKPGIDLGGGTSLIYAIDAQGLSADEKRGLAERMITVLRRRIDPANIQNMVWRPQGNSRIEIQMPLSSAEAREKRVAYERALSELLTGNVTPAAIMRSVAKPADERAKDFQKFAYDSNDRLQILENFTRVYDERKQLQQQRDAIDEQLQKPRKLIKLSRTRLDDIDGQVTGWTKLDKDKLKETLVEFLDSAKSSTGSAQANLDLLTEYTELYGEWAEVVEKLTDPQNGVNERYNKALVALHKLNLSEDQITSVLEIGGAEVGQTRQGD